MSKAEEPPGAVESQPPRPAGVFLLPALWIAATMALSLWSIVGSWPASQDFDLPAIVVNWLYAGMVVSLANILWGLWLLGLAHRRAAAFPRAFTVWHVANVVAIVALEAVVLVSDVFVFSLASFVVPLARVVIGFVLIAHMRRSVATAAVFHEPRGANPSGVAVIINTVLGAFLGGAAGTGGGFAVGIFIAEATRMSCFEGACGYFAALIGLCGLVLGALAGALLAFRITRRRHAG
ncbi:hypothetical protein FQ775_10545 [Nitratireductor mangrovi]|uniref:Uncharacterized protein n=1 Tax=Nitratireductor mangrovi TaxID=2599600 RepID=A0A5B8KZC2_9HYPH|nr:hypothetical protein [Nitratireductor mangrovi]QDZ00790.1 hypothetical protein FQ775_10545 [Nitratireductor mangrovi]